MTTEHLRFLKKFRRRRQMVVFLRILILFLFLLQWEICADTGVVDSFYLQQPFPYHNLFSENDRGWFCLSPHWNYPV